MVVIKYVVKRSFWYGNRQYQPGDEWTPAGGMWDKQIIATGKVTAVHAVMAGGSDGSQ